MHPKILSLENRNRFDEASLKKSRDDIELNGDDLISIIFFLFFFCNDRTGRNYIELIATVRLFISL